MVNPEDDAGGALLEHHLNKDTSERDRTCICGRPDCAELTNKFKALEDIRGGFTVTSNLSNEKKKKRMDRWRIHLCAPGTKLKDIASEDHRKKGKLRSQAKKVKRKYKRVAWHHFHPSLIKHYIFNKKTMQYICKEFVPTEMVKKYVHKEGNDNGYENADRFKKKYFLVPSYPLASAKKDLVEVEKTVRAKKLLNSVAARSRGSNSTRQAAAANPNQESSSRKRATPDTLESALEKISEQADEIQELKEAIRLMREQEAGLKEELEAARAAPGKADSRCDLGEDKFSGLNRFSIQSDKYHKMFPKACKTWFRFNDWSFLKDFIQEMFDVKYERAKIGKPLSKFDQILMTLFYIESDNSMDAVAQVYGYKDHSRVSKIVNAWLPMWGELGQAFSILPFIDADLIDELEPESYIKLGLRKVGGILDGKDWYTETYRSLQGLRNRSWYNFGVPMVDW